VECANTDQLLHTIPQMLVQRVFRLLVRRHVQEDVRVAGRLREVDDQILCTAYRMRLDVVPDEDLNVDVLLAARGDALVAGVHQEPDGVLLAVAVPHWCDHVAESGGFLDGAGAEACDLCLQKGDCGFVGSDCGRHFGISCKMS